MNRIRSYFQRVPKKYYRIALIVGICFFILIGLVSLIIVNKRDPLLESAIRRAKEKALKDYNIELTIEKAYFSGLTEVTLENVSVVPIDTDPLAKIQDLTVSVKIFPLITGTVKIAELTLENAQVTFVKKDSVSNYDFLFKKDAQDSITNTANPSETSLAKIADRMIHRVLYKIPENMTLRTFGISYKDDSLFQQIDVVKADIDNGKLESTILVNKDQATWYLNGDLDPGKERLLFQLSAESGKVEFPLIEQKYGLKVTFESAEAHLKRARWKGKEEFSLEMSGSIKNLLINHWRIASNDVIVPNALANVEIKIGKESVELAKTSEIKVNKLVAHPFAKLTLKPHKTYALGLNIPETDAQDAFDSFPKGLFSSLEGIKVSGELRYDFDLFLDTENPDSVRLSSSLQESGFKINAYGTTNFSKINSQFVYTPFEEGKPVRNIVVGPDNPSFTPLNDISPLLRNAVLTAEDPSFFQHNGFVTESIRASIATNFKEKAFKRGGSTISMQLVKNVFLDREKTLARKIEEMLIVWLIEHNDIVSKERMLEVYLNVIEWGRNVYGISEAAQHYFLKKPSELDLGESIFLASIVPSPKNGIYRFNEYGGLKPFLSGYYRLIGTLMANSGFIPRDSTRSYGFYSVSLHNVELPSQPAVDSTFQDDDGRLDLEREIGEAERLLKELFGNDTIQ